MGLYIAVIPKISMATTIMEHCQISPPADSMPEFSLPMLFFDMMWYDFVPNQSVLFFEFPGFSKSHFLDSIVSQLKTSLSLALSHFLPLAGNIIHPALNPENDKPIIRYKSGDSVSLTISESTADFNHLTGHHPRVCDDFYVFAPHLPPPIATESEYSIARPVMALQVTLFPGKGICIGFITDHAVADASSVTSFIQAWALINRKKFTSTDIGGEIADELKQNNCLSFYDRKDLINLNGLDSLYWDLIVEFGSAIGPPPPPPQMKFPTNKLRATFILKKEEIQKLKNLLLATCVADHVSSFTVVGALVWVCSVKTAGDDVADDDYFLFSADCRGRLMMSTPLLPPANYFGNCAALVMPKLKHGDVVKGINDGFVMAAKAIGEAIKENVYNEKGILHDAKNWPKGCREIIGNRRLDGMAGSPRFDFYAADYGWGKPNKFEALFIDFSEMMLLSKSREFEGGLEIGVSRPIVRMDAFATVFNQVLTNLLQ